MKYEDTVMKEITYDTGLVVKFSITDREIAEAQAEISFKAGIKKGYSAGKLDGQYTNHKRHGKKMLQARQGGRKEVVDWLFTWVEFDDAVDENAFVTLTGHKLFVEIQAKLKDWGL